MSGEPAGVGDEEREDEEGDAERTLKLNPELLQVCQKNDTGAAVDLIKRKAEPTCEDHRQWSPLIWAATHGNEPLTRLLIKLGTADVYKVDDSQGKGKRTKKHSPLHWAAFKAGDRESAPKGEDSGDHLKVLWLLLKEDLSHHEKDQIGNTALHQAAAGGSLECTKCLLSQGADVFCKNDRGHRPLDLCTVPEVQALLRNCMDTTECEAYGKQFSSTVLRYLCSQSLRVFCEQAVTQQFVHELHGSEEKECPVTWCTEVRNTVLEAERQLETAFHLNQLDTITAALASAEDKPVNVKLLHTCRQMKAKLESEIQLGEAMQIQVVTSLDEFGGIHEALSKAIEEAEAKNADTSRVSAARTLRRKLLSEASLMRAVQGQQKTTTGHLTMLEELTSAARAENANEELLETATNLITKLKSEREVQHRIAECQELSKLSSFKETVAKDNLPEWSKDTPKFEAFHEDYKAVVDQADQNKISKHLMDTSLDQLATLELILVERKQYELEMTLKASKKKKGMM